MKIAIIIPSRFGSSRFPGKPLHKIAGMTMIERVVNIALTAAKDRENVKIIVATDDERIAAQVKYIKGIKITMTSEANTGSDRVFQALKQENEDFDYIINFQGDAPVTHPKIISDMIDKIIESNNEIEVLTPYVKLSWEELDELRIKKNISPASSGTMLIKDKNDHALWFSKMIIPNIRVEERNKKYSPILRHVGIYAYRKDILEKFVKLPQSQYEKLEELEQLRFLENGHKIKVLDITELGYSIGSGIDRIEDVVKAEEFIGSHGEFFCVESLY